MTKIDIEGEYAIATSPEGKSKKMGLDTLMVRAAQRMDTGGCVLPAGVKSVLSRGNITIWVWEKPPCIQKFKWIRSDSPRHYGQGTTYRDVRIALPYLVILAVFTYDPYGMPMLLCTDECFFRNEPLKSMSDELLFPALLNCSKFGDSTNEQQPLSWICTQHLKKNKQMQSSDPADRFAGGFDAVRCCLLETGFNLSSEHHDGNSWFGASKKVIDKVSTIERWEQETKKDPMFAIDVPWIPTNRSLKQIIDRTFKRCGATDASVKSSNDLARIIFNG